MSARLPELKRSLSAADRMVDPEDLADGRAGATDGEDAGTAGTALNIVDP